MFARLYLPPLPKKAAQQFGGFLPTDSPLHLHLVVELRMIQYFENSPAGAGLGISGGEDQAVNARVNHGSGAHGAGLERHVERATGESIVAQRRSCRAQYDDL